jgi:hypothetical protein
MNEPNDILSDPKLSPEIAKLLAGKATRCDALGLRVDFMQCGAVATFRFNDEGQKVRFIAQLKRDNIKIVRQ